MVIIGFEQAALLGIACVSDTLDVASQQGADPRFDVRLASLRGRPVRGTSGLSLLGGTPVERVRDPIATLVVAGGTGHLDAAGNTEPVRHVRRLAHQWPSGLGVHRRVGAHRGGTAGRATGGHAPGDRP